MSHGRRPLLQAHAGGGESQRLWLDDDELTAIATVAAGDATGLSRTAKAVYRERRDGTNGRKFTRSFKARRTIATALSVDYDTVLRADKELERKGYIVEDGLHHGKTTVYTLRRGTEGERIDATTPREQAADRPPSPEPQLPQDAGLREVPPEGALTGTAPSGLSTAAEPSPAKAGSAAVEAKPPRRTGWRFVHTLSGGTYVRDPDGREPLPRGYSKVPDDTIPESARQAIVDELVDEPWSEEWLNECAATYLESALTDLCFSRGVPWGASRLSA